MAESQEIDKVVILLNSTNGTNVYTENIQNHILNLKSLHSSLYLKKTCFQKDLGLTVLEFTFVCSPTPPPQKKKLRVVGLYKVAQEGIVKNSC